MLTQRIAQNQLQYANLTNLSHNVKITDFCCSVQLEYNMCKHMPCADYPARLNGIMYVCR